MRRSRGWAAARGGAVLALLCAAMSCVLDEVTLDGAACTSDGRCVDGYACDPASWLCVPVAGGSSGSGLDSCDCVDPLPSGWQGPFYVFSTEAGVDPGACPQGDSTVVLHSGLPAAGTCQSCACGPPVGECSPAPLQCKNTGCSQGATVQTPPGQCEPYTNDVVSCRLLGDGSYQGSCQPQEVSAAYWPSWARDHTLCTVPADARCEGAPCANPALPAQICIRRDEALATCPAPWIEPVLAYQGADDTRACTPCSCDPATGNCDLGHWELYGNESCSELIATIDQQLCSPQYSEVTHIKAVGDPTPSSVGCAAKGGQPVPGGAFSPQGPVTLCCLPGG